MESFGDLLQRFRVRAGLTISELAEILGADRKSIRLWEQGQRVPRDRARLDDLAQVLKLSSAEAEQLTTGARAHRNSAAAVALPAVVPANPVRSSAATSPRRHQLRAPIPDFVGQQVAITTLLDTLRCGNAGRHIAVISAVRGMGGIGKTELAYYVANHLLDTYPDAQIVLNLRGMSATPLPPEQALRQVIHAFTPDASLPDDLEVLQAHYQSVLHNQRVLILADDARDAAQVRPLLPSVGCALLVTSRRRFSLPGMTTIDLEEFAEEAALTLVRTICPQLGAGEAQSIARACEYLPLALRISASLLHNNPALAVAGYLERLADEQQRLTHLRDPDDAQLDVEASLVLSYAQLDAGAQQVFRQIGIFVVDFTTPLALAVLEKPPDVEVLDVLHRLLRLHLVRYDAEYGRWHMHDLVRDLARHMLEVAGEWESTMWRYAHAAVAIAQERHEQCLMGGDSQLAALAWFDAERPHLDITRQWATVHAATEAGAALLVAQARATDYIGGLRYDIRRERLPQLERALAAARRLGDRHSEGSVLNRLGTSYLTLGDGSRAAGYFEHYLAMAQTLGDQEGECRARNNLGIAYQSRGDIRRAIVSYQQSLTVARAIGDAAHKGRALINLANAYRLVGQGERALDALESALVIFRELGAQHSEAIILVNLGLTYLDLGQAECAVASCEQALAIARALGSRYHEAEVLSNLGKAYLTLGQAERAIETCTRALNLLREEGDQREESYTLCTLGASYAALGDRVQARAAFEQALTQFCASGDRGGEAECSWAFGRALADWGERARALPLLHAAVAYKHEIGHAKAAEHAALLAQLKTRAASP
jgi:tetratricopeptide (TPR) repeat protein/transcriptional regulator with XRE-family HTH domain